MQVNVNAAFEMSRAMLPLLKAAQDSSLLLPRRPSDVEVGPTGVAMQ